MTQAEVQVFTILWEVLKEYCGQMLVLTVDERRDPCRPEKGPVFEGGENFRLNYFSSQPGLGAWLLLSAGFQKKVAISKVLTLGMGGRIVV